MTGMTSNTWFGVLAAVAAVLGILVLWLVVRSRQAQLIVATGAIKPVSAASFWRKRWQSYLAWLRGLRTILSKTARQRYQQTWVILVGQAGAGKSSLIASLRQVQQRPDAQAATIAGVPRTAWHSLAQGELIDPQGKLSAAGHESTDAGDWQTVLHGLVHLRPERALDGVLLVVSARNLLGAGRESVLQLALDARRQLDDLRLATSLALPVYVVVSQSDAVDGFAAYWRLQGRSEREGMFGWSARDGLLQAGPAQWIDEAFADIGERLKEVQVEVAAAQEQIADADAFFLFPRNFERLHIPLRDYLAEVFHDTATTLPALCRGVYFTGCTQASAAAGMPRADVTFAEDVVTQKALGERGLARATQVSFWSREPGLLRLQQACVTLAGFLVLALALSGWRLQRQVDDLGRSITALYQSQALAGSQDSCAGRPLIDDALTRAVSLDTHLVFVTMPLSWVDHRTSNNAVQAVSGTVMARTVFPALACGLQARIARLDAGLATATEPTLAGIPVSSSAYAKTRANVKALALEVSNLEDKLQRFARLTAIPAESTARKLDDLNLVYLYVYGAGLPAPAARPGGVVAASLKQVPYSGVVTVPERSRDNWARQLSGSSRQLHVDLLSEVSMGPSLLAKVDPAKGPLVENTRRFTSWLVWVGKSWAPSDPNNNPCADDAKELRQLFTPLVTQYGYPKELLAGDGGLDEAKCYNPTMQVLRGMQLSPYGPLLIAQGQTLVMNPALSGEVRGLEGLLQQTFMQVQNPQSFACVSSAPGWRLADLGRSMNYAADYQRFAAGQGLAPLGATATSKPLFDRVARAQLEQVMNDAMRSAQVAATASFVLQRLDAVSVADQQLLQQSGDFSRALDPLIGNLRLYTQFGFTASAGRVSQCARDFSSDALGRVSGLVSGSRLYDPEAGPADGLLVNLGTTPVIRDYLARQVARAHVLAGYADPFVNLLRNTDGVNDVQRDNAQTLPYWGNTINEVTSYVQFKDPGKQVGALDTLFLKTVADLTYSNCGKVLAGYQPADYGNDMFSERRRDLIAQLNLRCVDRRTEQATSAYDALAKRFNSRLKGRFPFGETSSPDASLAEVQAFFSDYAAQRESLQQSLASVSSPSWAVAARGFLNELDAADQFLRPGLGIGAAPQSLKLDIAFRALPKESPGSEQVVSWVVSSGPRVASFPSGKLPTLDWSYGQVLALDLNWAELSVWRPAAHPAQTGYRVDGSTASFTESGDWALLRMLQRYQPVPPKPADPLKPGKALLEFSVPTQRVIQATPSAAPAVTTGQATFYLGLTLSGTDPKSQAGTSLVWPGPFPKSAPQRQDISTQKRAKP